MTHRQPRVAELAGMAAPSVWRACLESLGRCHTWALQHTALGVAQGRAFRPALDRPAKLSGARRLQIRWGEAATEP